MNQDIYTQENFNKNRVQESLLKIRSSDNVYENIFLEIIDMKWMNTFCIIVKALIWKTFMKFSLEIIKIDFQRNIQFIILKMSWVISNNEVNNCLHM